MRVPCLDLSSLTLTIIVYIVSFALLQFKINVQIRTQYPNAQHSHQADIIHASPHYSAIIHTPTTNPPPFTPQPITPRSSPRAKWHQSVNRCLLILRANRLRKTKKSAQESLRGLVFLRRLSLRAGTTVHSLMPLRAGAAEGLEGLGREW